MQAEINAPNDTMFKIMTTVRKRLGQKAIEKNANQAVVEGGRTLEDFYVAENIAMEVKKSEEIDEKENQQPGTEKQSKGAPSKGKKGGAKEQKGKGIPKKVSVEEFKDIIFVQDPLEFFKFICEARGLDQSKVIVRIAWDGGDGMFLVVASVFVMGESEEDNDDYDNDDNDDDDNGAECENGRNDDDGKDKDGVKPKGLFKSKLNSG